MCDEQSKIFLIKNTHLGWWIQHWSFLGWCMRAKSPWLCPALCSPMDCSPPGSSVQGILQIRILEWVAMPFSRGSFQLRDWTHVSYGSCIGRHVLLLLVPPGNLRAVQLLISLDTGFIMSFFFLGSYIFLNIRQYMLKRGGWEININTIILNWIGPTPEEPFGVTVQST